MMDVLAVPFKPIGRHRHLSSGEVRRRSERATAAGISSLLCSPEFERWKRRKAQRSAAGAAAVCLLLALVVRCCNSGLISVFLVGVWLHSRGPPSSRTAGPHDLAHVLGIIRGAVAPEEDIAAAVELISRLHKEVSSLRTQAASLTHGSEKLHSRLSAALASSAEHERTAQQRQVELQSCRAAAAAVQERCDSWQQRASSCSTDLARAVKEKQAAENALRSASQAASQHEKAALAASAAQAECAARLAASQQDLRVCAAELTRTKQAAEEASDAASQCSREVLKVASELEYALSDAEALIERTGAARLRAAALLAATLALAILLTAAYTHRTKRKIVSLQLEREKLLLDKMEAESGGGLLRRRSLRVQSST